MKTPQVPREKVIALLAHVLTTYPCALLGVRGYYRDSMGKPGVQEAGIYDDAMFFVTRGGVFLAVAANTDPSRIGWNPGVGKNFAMLQPGLWHFIRGAHKGRTPALRQATEEEAEELGIPNEGEFRVWRAKTMEAVRNGTAASEEGYFAINIHRGGDKTTSSWGCQTIPPDVYDEFMTRVWQETKNAKQSVIPYLLVDGPIN